LSDGEDALGDTLLEQWMLVVLFGRRYFYHLSWGFICQMRGLFVPFGGEIDRFGGRCRQCRFAVTNGYGESSTTSTTTILLLLSLLQLTMLLMKSPFGLLLWKVLQHGLE
jgi:hypothetical protein